MIRSALLFLLILFPFQDSTLKKQKLTEYLTMEVSTSLREMTQQELSAKFLGAKIPDAALTDEASAIELTITGSPTFWLEKDLNLLKDFYDSSIPSLFSDIEFSKKKIVNINEGQFVAYEFEGTPQVDDNNRTSEKRYTYLLYTIFRNGLVTISFSCPPYLKDEWKPVAHQMFESIKLK